MKNESKFKIGDAIFYIENNIPKKGIIEGIVTYEGKCTSIYNSQREVACGKNEYVYHVGQYSTVEEKTAFATKEDLLNTLFGTL